ncbi:MAG: hypothetical protein G01um10143_399 [Parcubacteria group bacterium Gr01-1014_3]|nr:MAG: hypothetical protein G01um10143_399 [Parcubacteria group bacterium Gr01-1014_3]
MTKSFIIIFASFIILNSLFLIPSLATAQPFRDPGSDSTDASELPNPLSVGSITELLDKIIRGLLVIAIPIVTIMVLYGAFMIMSSAGDPGKIETGKKTILYAAIGFAILLVSNGISLIVADLIGYKAK